MLTTRPPKVPEASMLTTRPPKVPEASMLTTRPLKPLGNRGVEMLRFELNDLYSSPTAVRVIKSSKMEWEGHVACIGEGEVSTGFWWGNLRETDHW
jgi:hypothetical protein